MKQDMSRFSKKWEEVALYPLISVIQDKLEML